MRKFRSISCSLILCFSSISFRFSCFCVRQTKLASSLVSVLAHSEIVLIELNWIHAHWFNSLSPFGWRRFTIFCGNFFATEFLSSLQYTVWTADDSACRVGWQNRHRGVAFVFRVLRDAVRTHAPAGAPSVDTASRKDIRIELQTKSVHSGVAKRRAWTIANFIKLSDTVGISCIVSQRQVHIAGWTADDSYHSTQNLWELTIRVVARPMSEYAYDWSFTFFVKRFPVFASVLIMSKCNSLCPFLCCSSCLLLASALKL